MFCDEELSYGTQEGGRKFEKRQGQCRPEVWGKEVWRPEGQGKDYTLFAKIDGTVTFERLDRDRKKVSVYAS